MRYLKSFALLIVFIVFFYNVKGQDDQTKTDKEQELKSQRIAFFTSKIGLTSEEAQVFWPIYNSYWERKNKIISDRKEKMTYFSEHSTEMSTEDMITYADHYIHYEMELAELIDEYHKEFKKILPIDKVMRIYLADYEFKTYLLRKIRKKGDKDDF